MHSSFLSQNGSSEQATIEEVFTIFLNSIKFINY